MRQIFHIEKESKKPSLQLLCEWGENYCCWGNWDEETGSLTDFSFFSFQTNDATTVAALIRKMTQQQDAPPEVFISAGFPQSVLSPTKFANSEHFGSLVFGQDKALPFTDVIDNWQMVNQYMVPSEIERAIRESFPKSHFSHVYSTGIRSVEPGVPNALYTHFMPDNFRVLVIKESHVELAQTYAYTAPLDVVYYLLKVCQELHLSPEQNALILSGLIEQDSFLYQEITNYFFDVKFSSTPSMLSDSSLPAHYFTSLFNLASCASLAAH